jgi:probable rRNA maturation factor
MTATAPEGSSGSELAGGEPDEPPSPEPSGPLVSDPLTILTADRRSDPSSRGVEADLEALASLLARALVAEGVAPGAEASLTLVDPDEIAALKDAHLGGDGSPTDVLSFPIDGSDGGPGPWMVGDVVLCPEVAATQAGDHAGTLPYELALLVVHSALHLVGWDHADARDRSAMWSRERELLLALHGQPSRDPWSG